MDDREASPDGRASEPAGEPSAEPSPAPLAGPVAPGARGRRPMVERVGLGLIAAVFAALFGAMAAAAFASGEPFLGVMAGVGCLMTLWVGALTLIRG